jgi:hypothetical protein
MNFDAILDQHFVEHLSTIDVAGFVTLCVGQLSTNASHAAAVYCRFYFVSCWPNTGEIACGVHCTVKSRSCGIRGRIDV